MTEDMVRDILDGIQLDHEDYTDATEQAVRALVARCGGVGLSKLILDSTSEIDDPRRVARLFDILIWFPGVNLLDFATELRMRLAAGDQRTRSYITAMDAGTTDSDPMHWMIQTFPELAPFA